MPTTNKNRKKSPTEQHTQLLRILSKPLGYLRLLNFMSKDDRSETIDLIFELGSMAMALASPESQALQKFSMLRLMYEHETKHPKNLIYAWAAIDEWQRFDGELKRPDWAADAILAHASEIIRLAKADEADLSRLKKAFGFDSLSAVTALRDYELRKKAYFQVVKLMKEGLAAFHAFEQVGKSKGVYKSAGWVRNVYETFNPFMNRYPLPHPTTEKSDE